MIDVDKSWNSGFVQAVTSQKTFMFELVGGTEMELS